MILNREKLSEVLTANWTKFLDFRELGATAIQYANQDLGTNLSFPQTITCSRFDIIAGEFIIWMEISAPEGKITSEFIANSTGAIYHNKSIKSNCCQ